MATILGTMEKEVNSELIQAVQDFPWEDEDEQSDMRKTPKISMKNFK